MEAFKYQIGDIVDIKGGLTKGHIICRTTYETADATRLFYEIRAGDRMVLVQENEIEGISPE